MTQAELLELAKQGHAPAIAQLINQSLQPQGITATANLQDGCLQVLLEAQLVPKQEVLAKFIYQGALSLQANSIKSLIVYGKKFSNSTPSWSQTFDLVTPLTASSNVEQINTDVERSNRQTHSRKRNVSDRSKSRSRKSRLPKTQPPTIADPLSPEEECEQRLREIGRFPTKGKLSVSYYYAIPKLAIAVLSLIKSSDEIIDAIAVRYRGELAALIITEKYLACFLFPDFSKEAKKSFIFLFEKLKKVTIGLNGLIIYPKKYPAIKIYFQRKSFGKTFLRNQFPSSIFIEKRRWISPDNYEVSLNVFGFVVFLMTLGCNLITISFIIQHIITNLIGVGN
jgi:hypothetical protein